MKRLEHHHSYLLSILVSLAVVFGVLAYINGAFSFGNDLSGQAVADKLNCEETWEYSEETAAVYTEVLPVPGGEYLILVDNSNTDVDCLDPSTGKQQREYKNQFLDVEEAYYVDENFVRLLDVEDNDYIDLNFRTCLEEDRKNLKVVTTSEDVEDVMYDDHDYYIAADKNGKVQIYNWKWLSREEKDVKFSFIKTGSDPSSVKVDGLKYMVVWDDGAVYEYEVDEDHTFYQKTIWAELGVQDAEFWEDGVVLGYEDGTLSYLDADGVEVKSIDLELDKLTLHEFDFVEGSESTLEDQFLVSLYPTVSSTGKVVRYDCRV